MYITIADVARELSIPIDPLTTPNEASVEEFISQVEADLNGVLSAVGVSVPVAATSSGAYGMIRQAVTWGVCARVLGAYAGMVQGESPKETTYWDRYRDFMDRVTDDPSILYDATFDKQRLGVSGIADGHEDYREAIFSVEDVF